MQLSETIKLFPTKEQKSLILNTMKEYISTVNNLVSIGLNGTSIAKYTSKDVIADLPSALRCQCVRDANSIITVFRNRCHKVANKCKWYKEHNINKKVSAPNVPVLKNFVFT